MSADAPRVVVREADGDYLEAVVAVGHATVPTAHAELGEEIVGLYLAKWWTSEANVASIRAGRTLVVEADGEIAGMTSYGQHDGRLVVWKLYVRPEWQGRGLGRRLLSAVLDRVRDTHDTIWVSYGAGNESAARWLRSCGFGEDHREEQVGLPDLVWSKRDVARDVESHGGGQ